MKALKQIINILDNNLENWIIFVFYIYFIFIVLLEVTMRYGFNASTVIGEETARHAFIWLSWVAASAAVKKRMHIKIAFLELRVSNKSQYILNFVYNALFIIFCILTIYYVIPIIQSQISYDTLSRAAQYPMWIPYLSIPFGFGLMVIRVVQNIIVDIQDMRKNIPIQSGASLL